MNPAMEAVEDALCSYLLERVRRPLRRPTARHDDDDGTAWDGRDRRWDLVAGGLSNDQGRPDCDAHPILWRHGQQMIHNPIVKQDVFVDEALDNAVAEKPANSLRHSRHSMECDIADVLAGSYSHHRMQSMDESSRSRLLMQSTFSQRFSFVNPNNSAALSTFLLLNSMIGSGILNQPYVFAESGILGGIVGFVLAAIAIWTGLLCLTAAGIHENIHEYSALAHRAFQRNGERVVDVAIIVLTFGSQLGYILVVGTTLSTLFKSWGCDISLCNDTNITLLSVSVFVTPVCMFRHFGHLAYLSLFSVATIVAVILLVMIGGPIKHQLGHVAGNYEVFNAYGMLASLGSIVFSLDCASSNFQAFISTEESAQSLPSWREVTRNAVVCGAAMCMIMGLVGYLSFGADTDGDILDNFPQAGFDVFKVAVVIHLILYIPSNFVIMRYSIVKLFSGKRSEHLPSRTHTVLTIVLLAATVLTVIALLQLHLSSGLAFSLILNITGGIGGSMEAFILPSAIYLKLMPVDSPLYRPAQCLLCVGIAVMVVVVAMTIVTII